MNYVTSSFGKYSAIWRARLRLPVRLGVLKAKFVGLSLYIQEHAEEECPEQGFGLVKQRLLKLL